MNKVIVTGGCGFIGSTLVELLMKNGAQCVVVDNLFQNSFPNIAHLADKLVFSKTDIRNREKLDAVFATERPDVVFHLAAHHFIPYCDRNPDEAITTNIVGTQHIADLCQKHSVEKLFFASTAAVYGPSDEPHRETEAPNPMDIYGVTKMAGEKIMAILAKRCSIQVTVGRFFNAVGPRETNPHIIPEILKQLRERPDGPLLLGNLFPKRDYIHVSDIADAAIAATLGTRDSYDIVNIGAGNDVTVGGLVDLFADALGRVIPVECDVSRVRKTDRMRLRADNTKLRTKYGWRPQRSLEAAIEDLLATEGIPKAAAVTSASV